MMGEGVMSNISGRGDLERGGGMVATKLDARLIRGAPDDSYHLKIVSLSIYKIL